MCPNYPMKQFLQVKRSAKSKSTWATPHARFPSHRNTSAKLRQKDASAKNANPLGAKATAVTNRYTAPMSMRLCVILFPLIATVASAQTRTQDVIYMKELGTAFTMDIAKPAKPNKAAVIIMISGGWYSDHTMLQSYAPSLEKVFLDEGFTVFEVVHGAQPRFKVNEIIAQVQTAARFIKLHANEYGIEANRIGVSGISSGGHLSLMIAGAQDSPVSAVVAIAPPTDLANWGKPNFVITEDSQLAQFAPILGINPTVPQNDIQALLKQLSPISHINPKYPPTLIVHGDKDTLVPLQQAQVMDQALGKQGIEHKLEVIPGGGHDFNTYNPGLKKAVEWFQAKLLK